MVVKSMYVERWADAQAVNLRLSVALVALSFIVVFLSAVIVFSWIKPKPIFYVPDSWSGGVALPMSDQREIASIFAQAWVLSWNNFTPASVQHVFERAKNFMAPSMLAQMQYRFDKDLKEIKESNMSSAFSLVKEPVVRREKGVIVVRIEGDKGNYMGREEIRLAHVAIELRLQKVAPTMINPYGLLVLAMNEEVLP